MKQVEHIDNTHLQSIKNIFSVDNELIIAKQIQEEKLKLQNKMKKEELKQTNMLKQILIQNEEEIRKIQQLNAQNEGIARQIQENIEVDNGVEEAIKQKQDRINMLRQEYQKLCDQKNALQDEQIKQKNERKTEYYLNNEQQTIPICIEREKNKNKSTNEKQYKTDEEITEELRKRIEEIQISYI